MSYIRCCEKCTKREIGCHSHCEDYAAVVILNVLLETDRKKENQLREDDWFMSERRAKKRKQAGYHPNDKRLGQR